MKRPTEDANCRPESLTLYFYDELEGTVRLRVEQHLEECSACRRELSRLRSTLESLPVDESEFSPAEIRSFNERLGRRLRPRMRVPLGVPLGWSVAGAAGLLLALTLLTAPPENRPAGSKMAWQDGAGIERMPDPELLLNLDLLENLDLLQELEGASRG